MTVVDLKSFRSRYRTALVLLTAFFTIILLFSGFIYLSVDDYTHDDFYHLLEIRGMAAVKVEVDSSRGTEIRDFRSQIMGVLPKEKEQIFLISDVAQLETLADSLDLPVSFLEQSWRTGSAEFERNSIFYKGLRYNTGNQSYLILASAENYYHDHHTAYLQRTMITAIISSFLLSVIIAYFFSHYVFNPLRNITSQVKQISSENLHLRLDSVHKNEELNNLAQTFNGMLDRIETSFETQNNFISNASHELRTPLTAIIGEADVALSKLRQPEEYIESIKIILDEAEKLDRKTRALLFLAQTGFNGKVLKFEKVRIDQLLWDVKETLERIDPRNQVQLDMSLLPENPSMLKIKGNEQLMHLAFTNIISNGCKYSDHQPVYVSLGASNTHVIVVIRDRGIGIPEAELKYIYDPFFRASNTNNYEGYGIGLPLTRNIIRMHEGKLEVSSQPNQGTTVQISLPIGKFDL